LNGAISGWIKSKMVAGGDSLYVCTQTMLCPRILTYNDGDSKHKAGSLYPTYGIKRKNEKADLEK